MDNNKLAYSLIGLVVSMLLLAYAAVPLYNLFCKVTGFGGTTQIAKVSASRKSQREITVRFDANVDPNLPWQFKPEQKSIKIKLGENALVFYRAINVSDKDIVGTSVYNVTPSKAGLYFNKIHCFCFEEQLLKAGQNIMMPVAFFIDPELEDNPEMDDINTITLSYSFYKVREHNKHK